MIGRVALAFVLLSCAPSAMTEPGLKTRPPSGGDVAQARPPQSPVRDNAPAVVGTAAISGSVVTDDAAGQPLRRVTVMLSSGGLQTPQGTITDDAGRFRFAGIAPGNYTVAATRAGYVPAFYGAKHAGKGPGIPIAVLDGQHVDNIEVRMIHGGAITGMLRSPAGQPAAGLGVQVVQVQMVDGQRRGVSSTAAIMALAGGPITTDDRGIYRVYGLAPGEYVVQTQTRALADLASSESRQVTAGEVQWAQQAIAQAPSGVATPGGPALTSAPSPGQTVSYAPVYFPGTTVSADAAIITLAPGEERRGVDFSTQLVPTARITGTVLDPDGRPMQGVQVSVKDTKADSSDIVGMVIGMLGAGGGRTAPDGTFSLGGVPPGHYALTARGAPRPEGRGAGAGAGALGTMLGGRGDFMTSPLAGMLGLGGNQPWWASEDISVDGHDLPDVTLRMQPGMTVSGRIVFEGTTAPPADLTKTRISLGSVPTSSSPLEMAISSMIGTTTATTAADGTFVAKGVTPGRYRANLAGPGLLMGLMAAAAPATTGPAPSPAQIPAGTWMLKSIMWKGRDLADIPFDVKPNEDVTGVVLTMIDRRTELTGAVLDSAGRATGSFPIVVFSTDRASWTIGSRRVQQARPASDGKFRLAGLPAGEYYVCAVTELDPEDLYNPVFLDQLVAGAFKITLADGEKKVQDIKLNGSGTRH